MPRGSGGAGCFDIPEGIYPVDGLNPASRYHLSIRIGYPNASDRAAAREGRTDLGDDIYIHGGSATIGCIPVGDAAVEELFCLVAAPLLASQVI